MHPKYQQITNKLEYWIRSEKKWIAGERLPSIRQLAVGLSVSKNTIIHALTELESKQIVEARPKVGYFVKRTNKPLLTTTIDSLSAPSEVKIPELFRDIMMRSAAFDIKPNIESRPRSNHLVELNRYINRTQRHNHANIDMYYDKPLGDAQLRYEIAKRYRKRGLLVSPDTICITAGCQHALFLALFTLCQPGDNVAVESPTFYGVVQLLEQLQLNVIEIPSSPEDGISTEHLAKALEQWKIKACVTTPNFATPTGSMLSTVKRQTLLSLANSYDFYIVEDDIYGELSFQGETSPLKALDTHERVILCGSFSKSLSRELRIGWIISTTFIQPIVKAKLVTQLASPQAIQQALARFLSDGHYRRHLTFFKTQLIHHKHQLEIALNKYFPKETKYTSPDGGIALWVELPESVNATELYNKALTENIVVTPGQLFSNKGQYANFLRLSFNHPTVGVRSQAIKKLAKMF
jgi:DNA-binding transcriptional MocR family regulator